MGEQFNVAKMLSDIFDGSKVEDGWVIMPESWNLSIYPQIVQTTDSTAAIEYFLKSSKWDREMYELTIGTGQDTETAIGMALGNFFLCILDGIKMVQKEMGFSCGQCECEIDKETFSSEFAEQSHNWTVYKSNVLGIGESVNVDTSISTNSIFWEMLKGGATGGLIGRLGNQKLCYVKIFAMKNDEEIVGECRINDVVSPELSEWVADYVKSWNVKGFATQKQFLFFVQDESTYTPYPYNQEQINKYVNNAILQFAKCKNDDDYNTYHNQFIEYIGDYSLASEIVSFLPEMCTERAFDEELPPMEVLILFTDKDKYTITYKTQLASYYLIWHALNYACGNGLMSKETYSNYISISSTYDAMCQAKEKDSPLTSMNLAFNLGKDYQLR